MKFDAIIFDLDGVICFTDEYHYLAWKKIADDLQIPFDREINNRLRGVSRMESLDIILENYEGSMSSAEKEEIATQKNEIYKDYLKEMSEKDLSPEVQTTLNKLRRKGLLLAVGSSSKNAGFILRQIGLEGFFNAVSDGNNITNSKPDPEVFLKAAEYLHVDPEKCLVVEDAVSGVEAGHRAGMKVAALGEASRVKAADWNLETFSQLLDIAESEQEVLLATATSLLKEPYAETVTAPRVKDAAETETAFPVVLNKKEKILLDFQDHYVGYLSLQLGYRGSHPDAPVLLRVRFAERMEEFAEDAENYHGWICSSWIQEERLHVDLLPCVLDLPRRYAFRYIEIEVLDISSKYSLIVERCSLKAVSGVRDNVLSAYEGDKDLKEIDRIACRTLHNCMQTVFEDGPKRDRRLWLGDLRLQALANYETYKDYDMVKACLYLFAALPMANGKIGAGIFLEPEPEVDDQELFDYSLLFVPTLLDYYLETKDFKTLEELAEPAFRQITLALSSLGTDGVICDSDKIGWCFLDWTLELNKQAGAQGVLLYAIRAAEQIAEILHLDSKKEELAECSRNLVESARKIFRDETTGFYLSGSIKQLSWASQIWMILGGAVEKEQACELLRRLPETDAVKPVTPYLYHYYLEALLKVDMKEEALQVIRDYWGSMVKQGVDTFPELYNPDDPTESPYGGTIVNSYCHAWSCTPAYFLRKYYR